MSAKDAAFMWETEALRSPAAPAPPGYPQHGDRDEGWLTLRETESATGIPISTLRKWVRKEAVPSFIDETPNGPIRMLWLRGVEQRAQVLGRKVTDPPVAKVEIDLKEEEAGNAPSSPVFADSEASDTPAEPDPAPPSSPDSATTEKEVAGQEPPPGTMVVPIEAWDKMLLQLGNLHEAGQQLAEARERAGKAETEAKFLRERLSELRAKAQEQQAIVAPAAQPSVSEPPQSRKRVSIEIEDGESDSRDLDVPEPVEDPIEEELVETQSDETPLSVYSAAVVKHLWGTWRDRPRR